MNRTFPEHLTKLNFTSRIPAIISDVPQSVTFQTKDGLRKHPLFFIQTKRALVLPAIPTKINYPEKPRKKINVFINPNGRLVRTSNGAINRTFGNIGCGAICLRPHPLKSDEITHPSGTIIRSSRHPYFLLSLTPSSQQTKFKTR